MKQRTLPKSTELRVSFKGKTSEAIYIHYLDDMYFFLQGRLRSIPLNIYGKDMSCKL